MNSKEPQKIDGIISNFINSQNNDKYINPEEKGKKCRYCGIETTEKIMSAGAFNVHLWELTCDCEKKKQEKEREERELERKKIEEQEKERERLRIEEQKKERERIKRVSKISNLRRNYYTSGFAKRYRNKRLRNLTCEHIQEAKNFIDNFTNSKNSSLCLIGGYGSGKTTLAQAVGKELYSRGYKVKIATMDEYLIQFQDVTKFQDTFNEIMGADFLVIDDFGREKYTEKRYSNVFLFFNTLYNNSKKFILTANPENMRRFKDGDNAEEKEKFAPIYDRLCEMTKILHFKNASFRRAIKN